MQNCIALVCRDADFALDTASISCYTIPVNMEKAMDTSKTYSYPLAMLDFFGKRPGNDSTADFMAELKALTDTDKAEFREMLTAKGYKLT